jgi:hypothetical protein
MSEPIRIIGLRPLVRSLRRAGAEFPKALKAGFKEAAELIVADAKPKVPTGPPAGGHAVRSIRPSSTASRVSVSEGGARFPYMAWLDFGGKVGPNNSVTRPFRKTGRYIWSSFADRHAEVLDRVDEAVADAARQAGLDVTTGRA